MRNWRPTQCVPCSPLSKYFRYNHWWMLWLFLWLPLGKETFVFIFAPSLSVIKSKGGKEKSEVQGRCGVSCLCHSFILNLSSLQMVGCDYEIDSNATEDRCGVCLGDGSACQTVRKMFKQKEGSGNKQINNWSGRGLRMEGKIDYFLKQIVTFKEFKVEYNLHYKRIRAPWQF